jgi:hypothetical protein
MIFYQYIGLFIGIIGITVTFLRFKTGKMTFNTLLLWAVIWVLLIIFSIYPDATSILANATGIGRGLDMILILGLIGCYYFIFRIYNLIENIEEEITDLVREIALEKGKSENKENNPSKNNNNETP